MLVIDRLGQSAERAPHALLLPERTGGRLTNAEAWAKSGAVASWLIAQGFGPGARSIAVPAGHGVERTLLLLGALRAGTLVVDGSGLATLAFVGDAERLVTPQGIALAALARCSIDAAVAERRLHIDANTPARLSGDRCRRHGDFATVAQAVGD
jgi:feruloyl-CoA synthase